MFNKNNDIELSFSEIVQTCDSDPEWLISIIEENVIEIEGDPREAIFTGYQLGRIRTLQRISRDFEASAPAAALILQLIDELDDLRKFLRA